MNMEQADIKVGLEMEHNYSNKKQRFPARKLRFKGKLRGLLEEYDTFLIISIDNVSTKHMDKIRKDYHGTARFLFGKNTLMRRVICDYVKETGKMELMAALEFIKGNSGLCFINTKKYKSKIDDIGKELVSRRIESRGKVGMIAPCDVFLKGGRTGIEPKYTQFLQSMNIPTRINGGQINIRNKTHLICKGDRICESESQLLSMLNIKPFYFGIKIELIYQNGNVKQCHHLNINNKIKENMSDIDEDEYDDEDVDEENEDENRSVLDDLNFNLFGNNMNSDDDDDDDDDDDSSDENSSN